MYKFCVFISSTFNYDVTIKGRSNEDKKENYLPAPKGHLNIDVCIIYLRCFQIFTFSSNVLNLSKIYFDTSMEDSTGLHPSWWVIISILS